MNIAESGQSTLKHYRTLCLTEAVKHDMVKYAFQMAKYKRFIKTTEKVSGKGPTLKKRTKCERAEECRFVDQLCDVIENGDLLDEREDPDEMLFMPSARAKHKAPKNDVSIQEKKNKRKNPPNREKTLPDRSGRGF